MKPRTIYFLTMNPEPHHSNYFELGSVDSWGPRVIQDYEFILIVSGRFGYYESGEKPLLLDAGDVLRIPPGAEHVFKLERRVGGSASIACLHLDFEEGLRRIDGDYVLEIEPPALTRCAQNARVNLLFKGIAETRAGGGPRAHGIAVCMIRELFLRLAEIWQGRAPSTRSERAKEMGAAIIEKLDGRVGRKELARRFGICPARVDGVFKEEFGMTPTEFLHAQRVVKACSLLLEDGCSVKETASLLGYSDAAHFSKVFKRRMGVPPGRLAPAKKGSL